MNDEQTMIDPWSRGQKELAVGKYVAARLLLEEAEELAWKRRDAAALARIYLPLLEARRLIRYQAAEGRIVISQDDLVMTAPAGISERLLLLSRGGETRIVSPGDPVFEAGLPVERTADASAVVAASTDIDIRVPLPSAGEYAGKVAGLGALARESILIAWEALALKWQRSHSLNFQGEDSSAWQEIRWLRQALQVDPACEPAAMRLMHVAEGIERQVV